MATISKQKKVRKVRQKLKLFRANEPLKSVLMWGINYSFSALNHVKPRAMLLKDDFKAYVKVKINNYLFNKENMPSKFKFKEYCPMVFKTLRDRFGVNKVDYWDAFTRHQPLWDSARGKSGSKFLVTYNRQFVAKTISSEEVEQMHQMLEEYYAYIVSCHGQTLLPQYLGLYRLTVNDQETYILVMRNVFSPRLAVHKKYDLKVSSSTKASSRKVSLVRQQTFHTNDPRCHPSNSGLTKPRNLTHRRTCSSSKPLPTLKDNDFLNDVCKIYIGEDAKTRVMGLMEADVRFLQDNNLMDYSLLIGIHEVGTVSEQCSPVDDVANELPGGPGALAEDPLASAGDGMGTIASMWRSRRFSASGRPSIQLDSGLLGATGGNLSAGDDDDDEDTMFLSDTGAMPLGASANLTPPDSPTNGPTTDQPFCGDLHPHLEYYAIKSSPESPRQLIYFVAIIDILTRYGMRKRTAQTYKTVKHGAGADISTVKPELYGRRLLDFISQCIE